MPTAWKLMRAAALESTLFNARNKYLRMRDDDQMFEQAFVKQWSEVVPPMEQAQELKQSEIDALTHSQKLHDIPIQNMQSELEREAVRAFGSHCTMGIMKLGDTVLNIGGVPPTLQQSDMACTFIVDELREITGIPEIKSTDFSVFMSRLHNHDISKFMPGQTASLCIRGDVSEERLFEMQQAANESAAEGSGYSFTFSRSNNRCWFDEQGHAQTTFPSRETRSYETAALNKPSNLEWIQSGRAPVKGRPNNNFQRQPQRGWRPPASRHSCNLLRCPTATT